MSGGEYFDYDQYRIGYIIERIEDLIRNNKSKEKNQYGEYIYKHYPLDVIKKFKTGLKHIKLAQVYIDRIDYLLADDDGIDSFKERLEKDLKGLS